MQTIKQLAIGAALLCLNGVVHGQKPIAYPAKNQSAQQQVKDDAECLAWAKQQTGVDPAAPAPGTASAAQPPAPKGGVIKGAAAGAAIGAISGNDVGDAAATGAVVGGVAQAARRKGQAEAQKAQQQAAAQQSQQALQTYYRAYGACMSGRGYSVN